jgi:hypothetical protein
MRILTLICSFLFGRTIRLNMNGFARAVSSKIDAPELIDEKRLDSDSEVPLLPSADGLIGVKTLAVGDTLRLDELGPIILNEDGTISRISNWDELTQREKDKTFKMISKRNAERAKVLSSKLASRSIHDEEQSSDITT